MRAVPETWHRTTVGNLCSFESGTGFGPSDWTTSGLPIIRIQNLNGSQEFNYYSGDPDPSWIVEQGELLFAWAGVKGVSFGPTIWRGPRGVLNQHIYRIRPIDGVELDWLYLQLMYVTSSIEANAHGFKSNLVHVRKADITGQVCFKPPINEQRAIANVMATWDHAIRQLTDLIAAKVRFKQGLMQQLLTGKRRFPEFKEEWKHVRLGDVVSVRKDARTPSEDCPLYSLTIENGITPKSDRYDRLALVRDKGSKKYKVVCPLDIVFNPSNLRWGAIGISRESQEVVVSPIYEVVYVSDEFAVDPFLLFQALSAPHQIARFATMCEGTLVERMAVKLPTFLNCHIPFPPTLSEQRRIADTLGVADRNICLLRQQLEALKQQKKALMLKLLTGQVRVKP